MYPNDFHLQEGTQNKTDFFRIFQTEYSYNENFERAAVVSCETDPAVKKNCYCVLTWLEQLIFLSSEEDFTPVNANKSETS